MTFKNIAISLVSVFVLIAFVVISANLYDSQKRDSILSQSDTRLLKYDLAKEVARDVADLISIRSEQDYVTQRQKLSKNMTQALVDEYFPTVKYEGGKKTFTLTEKSITGEIVAPTEFVFKLELILTDGDINTPVTFLVYIKDNIITRIQSLG